MKYIGFISYNGAAYKGFERQPHVKSIQGTIEKTLSSYFGVETLIKAAGRTDAGVHAYNQVISFDSPKEIDIPYFIYALNRMLPNDIAFNRVLLAPSGFDPRHSSKKKEYVYKFSLKNKNPFDKDLRTDLGTRKFDYDGFEKALSYFLGKHDFSNFTSKKEDKDNFIRTISSIKVSYNEDKTLGEISFIGDHFMTYQIRYMVGASFKVAFGKLKESDIPNLLNKKPRHIVSFKAPADGLYLVKVYYDGIE